MSRFITNFSSSKQEVEIDTIIQKFIQREGFKLKKYKGGMVYKKGMGFFSAAKFMIIEREGTKVHIEAWIKAMGEQGFDGIIAFMPKRKLKRKVEKLIAGLR